MRQYSHGPRREGAGDYAGTSVALSWDGTRLAVGAIGNNNISGNNAGHVRVYYADLVFSDGFESGSTSAWVSP